MSAEERGKTERKTKREIRLELILNQAVAHQLANRGTGSEFYVCYTYPRGKFPKWIRDAKRILGAVTR